MIFNHIHALFYKYHNAYNEHGMCNLCAYGFCSWSSMLREFTAMKTVMNVKRHRSMTSVSAYQAKPRDG